MKLVTILQLNAVDRAAIERSSTRARTVRALHFVLVASCLIACDAVPDVLVDPEGRTLTSEAGASVKVSVSLARPPAHLVTVRAVSSNADEAAVSDPVSFDRNNWREPQEIVVSGIDDGNRDGDVAYTVAFVASEPARRSRVVELLRFVNQDDDSARFDGLGDLPGGDTASYASAVSDSGEVVVGWSRGPDGDEAFRWTASTGLRGLGGAASQAHAVSPNGSLIAGTIAEATYEQGRAAAIWRAEAAFELLPGPRTTDGSPLFWMVDAGAVRDDGYVFGTCIQYNAYGTLLKCVYSPVDRDQLQVDGAGQIFAADDAGNYAGTSLPDPHAAGLWGSVAVYNGMQLGYPAGAVCIRPHACRSEARDFSADGAVIVGTSRLPMSDLPSPTPEAPLYDAAFVYTAETGMVRLSPEREDSSSAAFAIDASGRVIGGFGSDAHGQQALLWVDRQPRVLEETLLEAGAVIPTGWTLREVRAISPDGRILVGNATNSAGNAEAFRAVLPHSL